MTIKLHGKANRVPMFIGLESIGNNRLWWSDTLNKWFDPCNRPDGNYTVSPFKMGVRSVKVAIRHIRKHDEIPKGAKMRLVSRFIGYDIEITK